MRNLVRLAGIACTIAVALILVLALRATDLLGPSAAPPEPSRPSGPSVSARVVPDPVGRPIRVTIPAIGVDAPLTGLGLNPDGSTQTPALGKAGWYELGPTPGDAGAALVVAHLNGPTGPDVFWRLTELTPGDAITIHGTRGTATFVVTGAQTAPKDDLPYDRIWPGTEAPLLRLITCAPRHPDNGLYPNNLIVYARLR